MASIKAQLEADINCLRGEVTSSMELRNAIEMLIKISRNLLVENPRPEQMRIRIGNASFNSTVWKFLNARQLLFKSGWVQEEWNATDGSTISVKSRENVQILLQVLVENRDVTPLEGEWVAETKHVVTHEESRRVENEEKQKRVQEARQLSLQMQKEKADRKELAQQIKLEAKADREYRNIRAPKSDAQIIKEEFNRGKRPIGWMAGPGPAPDSQVVMTPLDQQQPGQQRPDLKNPDQPLVPRSPQQPQVPLGEPDYSSDE